MCGYNLFSEFRKVMSVEEIWLCGFYMVETGELYIVIG